MAISPTIERNLEAITASTDAIRVELEAAPPPAPEPEPPTPEPTPPTRGTPEFPVRGFLIFPADWPVSQLSMYQGVYASWFARKQAWTLDQTGKTFDYEVITHRSRYTLLELQTGEGGDAGKIFRDGYGHGIWETGIWEKVVRGEIGAASEVPGKNVWRWSACVLGAGGWAGGRHTSQNPNHPTDDVGMCIIGHWQLKANVTKRYESYATDPWFIQTYGDPRGLPIPSDHAFLSNGGAWSHELDHAFNVHCHQGNLMGDGTTLITSTYSLDSTDLPHPDKRRYTPAQASEFLQYNQRFIA